MGPTRQVMLARAAHMRGMPPEPEKRLWRHLSGSRLGGFKFRRQATIGARIVDFFCPAKGLIVEIDGDTHDAVDDAKRDCVMMRSRGYTTLRFTNIDVMSNLEGVLETIVARATVLPDRWPANVQSGCDEEGDG